MWPSWKTRTLYTMYSYTLCYSKYWWKKLQRKRTILLKVAKSYKVFSIMSLLLFDNVVNNLFHFFFKWDKIEITFRNGKHATDWVFEFITLQNFAHFYRWLEMHYKKPYCNVFVLKKPGLHTELSSRNEVKYWDF